MQGFGARQLTKIVKAARGDKNDPSKFKRVVCTHWLQGNCKKGESCTFLHEDIENLKPLCRFFKETGACSRGGKCPFRH